MDAKEISELFKQKGLTLGSIESFTGGLFAREITRIPGASKFYKGAIVTYATEEKVRLLKISQELVDKYGVVSNEIASEMASHGRYFLNVDVCVSFTGNAGPSAMENKPVGEIYIGVCTDKILQVYGYHLSGTREEIQEKALKKSYEILAKLIK